MTRYASGTDVSTDKSKAEIEKTLQRYGADEFCYATKPQAAMVGFRIKGRYVRICLPLPDPKSGQFTRTPGRGLVRTSDQAYAAWEQACRELWRALALVIKAKLEAVESGISTVEREFLADTMLPDGRTVGQSLEPLVQEAYDTGRMPSLMPVFDAPALRDRND
jgi:hypothetical protein